MLSDPVLGLLVEPFDIGLELVPVHSPYPAPADLDAGQLVRAHKGINLLDTDREIRRDVLQREKPRLERRPRSFIPGPSGPSHPQTLALDRRQ